MFHLFKKSVDEFDNKFIVFEYSYLYCDRDFGVVGGEKKCHKHIFVPKDLHQVIASVEKKRSKL